MRLLTTISICIFCVFTYSVSSASEPVKIVQTVSADNTSPKASPKPASLDRKQVESVLKSFFLAHLIYKKIKAHVAERNYPQTQVSGIISDTYWSIIDDYTQWFTENKVTPENVEQFESLFNSPGGNIYKKVAAPNYPTGNFEKAVLNQSPLPQPKAADLALTKEIIAASGLWNQFVAFSVATLKKNNKAFAKEDVEAAFQRLSAAFTVALEHEGMTPEKLKKFHDGIVSEKIRSIFFVVQKYIESHGEDSIIAKLPPVKK